MTMPRQVIPGRTYLISRRCTQRQFLLRPSEGLNRIFRYCLGEAAARFQITLHGWVAMSNHQHLVIRDNLGNYPEFLAHLDKMLAKVLNRYWKRWENFWATEQPNVVYLVEAGDRFDKLIYLLTNPVNDHLVDRVGDWPGAISLREVLSGTSIKEERPTIFFREDGKMPKEVTLRCERPEGFENVSNEAWDEMVRDAIAKAESRARKERRDARKKVVGRRAVLRASPNDTPQTAAVHGGLRPHIACKNKDRRVIELVALQEFRDRYRKIFVQWRKRVLGLLFPTGTYRLMLFGVPCAPFFSSA